MGKSRVELQKEIKALYVPKFYRNLTVTIEPDQRFFYVYGEVNKPDRHFYAGELTSLGPSLLPVTSLISPTPRRCG